MAYLGQSNSFPFDPTRTTFKQLDAERFSGNNSDTTFTLTRKVYSPVDIEVFVDNVRQEPTVAYSVVDFTTLTFTEAPPTGSNNIYVIYKSVELNYSVGVQDGSITYSKLANSLRNFTVDVYTANGSGQTFVLSEQPASANTLMVSIDGVVQVAPTNYSVSGTTLIFTEAPDASSNVVVKHLGFRTTSVVTVLSDDSVTTSKILNSAVTTGKIADGAITTAKIAANAITTQEIAGGAVQANNIADTAVTPGTYGGAAQIPVVVVDQQGRLTSASNVAVSIPSGSYVTDSNNVILTTNTQITANVTVSPNTGGLSIGPVIIDADQTVTVSANARWVIL